MGQDKPFKREESQIGNIALIYEDTNHYSSLVIQNYETDESYCITVKKDTKQIDTEWSLSRAYFCPIQFKGTRFFELLNFAFGACGRPLSLRIEKGDAVITYTNAPKPTLIVETLGNRPWINEAYEEEASEKMREFLQELGEDAQAPFSFFRLSVHIFSLDGDSRYSVIVEKNHEGLTLFKNERNEKDGYFATYRSTENHEEVIAQFSSLIECLDEELSLASDAFATRKDIKKAKAREAQEQTKKKQNQYKQGFPKMGL